MNKFITLLLRKSVPYFLSKHLILRDTEIPSILPGFNACRVPRWEGVPRDSNGMNDGNEAKSSTKAICNGQLSRLIQM